MPFNESQFENPPVPSLEKQKKTEEKESKIEIMETPEIVIQPEKGINLMSAIMKGCNPGWGNHEHDLSKLTEQYFSEHPLDSRIKDTIKKLEERGVDEESLYNLSLTYQRSDRTEAIFDVLRKHKGILNPEEVQQKLLESLELLDSNQSFKILESNFVKYTQEDILFKEKQLGEIRQKIEGLIDFFKPKAETTKVKRINLIPEDFLYHKRSGKSFGLGEELALMSSREDFIEGQAHEFLHSVINSITDRLDKNLTESQKEKIVQLASGKLKEHYGQNTENYYSLLNESLIRTYLNIFEKGDKPLTYKNFRELIFQKVPGEKQFQEAIIQDKGSRERLGTLGISNQKELLKKSKNYFDAYEKDDLGKIVFGIYKNYNKYRLKTPDLTFEDFFLEKFVHYLERSKESNNEQK